MSKDQYYAIVKINSKTSKYYGNQIWEIQFVGLSDRYLYKTYVDPLNRNYAYWRKIIENPHQGFILTKCRLKRDHPDLISADSRFTVVFETTREQLFDEIITNWTNID